MTRLPIALALVFVTFDCPARRKPVYDYIFGITGLVTTEAGAPIAGAEVVLEVSEPVYDAVTPVKTKKLLTGSGGGFKFMYITGDRDGVPYTITVRKDGFEPQTVSGKSPPEGDHLIRLKRASARN